jgi:Mn-containing catalase
MFFTDDLHHDRPAVGGRTGRDHSQGLHRQPRPGRGGRLDEPGPGHRLRRRATAGRQLRQAWSGKYIVASGNLFADFHANATAEMQGIMQATRLYNMTDDPGVREMLRFNIARDTMHQNMWLAALEELRADGPGNPPGAGPAPVRRAQPGPRLRVPEHVRARPVGRGTLGRRPRPRRQGRVQLDPNVQPSTGEPAPPLSDPLLYATAPDDGKGPAIEPGKAPTTGGLIHKVKEALT